MNKYPVWLDCDVGVDDAIAIMALHALEETDLLAISTVSGNVPPEIRRPTTSMAVTAARRQSTVLRTAALRMRPRSCSMAVGRMHSASHKSVKFRFFMRVFLFEMDCRLPTG